MNADEAPQTAAAALLTPPKQIRARRDVVFVHGLIGSFCEPETFRALGDDVACWAPDLYGYGADSSREITTARQVSSLREHVLSLGNGPVHLVAHSIGAVYAFELADARPDLVESLTTVEGNFSLKDAFWSQALAALGENEARHAITARLSDPAAFLASDGITLSPELLTRASNALAFQPWSTVWASAKAILTRTSQPDYQEMVSRVFGRMPVYLIGGERSASQWDVQEWARDRAAGSTVMGWRRPHDDARSAHRLRPRHQKPLANAAKELKPYVSAARTTTNRPTRTTHPCPAPRPDDGADPPNSLLGSRLVYPGTSALPPQSSLSIPKRKS